MMIVEDTIAIGRRLKELQQGEFVLPPRISLLIATDVIPPVRVPPGIETVFVLQPTGRIMIAHMRQPEAAVEHISELSAFLARFFPSITMVRHEIAMSADDCRSLIGRLQRR